jgi:hypothetical protein
MDVALICWVFVQRSLDAQVFANKRQTVIFFNTFRNTAALSCSGVGHDGAFKLRLSEFIPNAPAATHDVTYA